jgi:hypothetical protein
MDMVELLLLYGFDTLKYFWVKITIGICTFVDYYVAKERQQYFIQSIPRRQTRHQITRRCNLLCQRCLVLR